MSSWSSACSSECHHESTFINNDWLDGADRSVYSAFVHDVSQSLNQMIAEAFLSYLGDSSYTEFFPDDSPGKEHCHTMGTFLAEHLPGAAL